MQTAASAAASAVEVQLRAVMLDDPRIYDAHFNIFEHTSGSREVTALRSFNAVSGLKISAFTCQLESVVVNLILCKWVTGMFKSVL